jgi:hypothetical protein
MPSLRPLASALPRRLSPAHPRRALRFPGVAPTTRHSSSFQDQPAPPRLPADQQAEFERLQRAAEAALSSHTQSSGAASATEAAPASPMATSRHVSTPAGSSGTEGGGATATATLSGGIRKGAPPEFEGDKNPRTGEVGGPKNEPLRWGSGGDWSFNGRVTDF